MSDNDLWSSEPTNQLIDQVFYCLYGKHFLLVVKSVIDQRHTSFAWFLVWFLKLSSTFCCRATGPAVYSALSCQLSTGKLSKLDVEGVLQHLSDWLMPVVWLSWSWHQKIHFPTGSKDLVIIYYSPSCTKAVSDALDVRLNFQTE